MQRNSPFARSEMQVDSVSCKCCCDCQLLEKLSSSTRADLDHYNIIDKT